MAEVGGLPDSSIIGGHVENILMAGDAGDGHGAASAEGTDHAPVETLIHRGIELLGGGWRGAEDCADECDNDEGKANSNPRPRLHFQEHTPMHYELNS